MARRTQIKKTNPVAVWHAYVVRGYSSYPYNVHTMVDRELFEALKQYLRAVLGDDEWVKMDVLNLIRDVTRSDIRQLAKQHFPSVFRKRRPACPLLKPEEVPEITDVDLEAGRIFREYFRELKASRREENMENAAVTNESVDGVIITITRFENGKKVEVQVNAGQLTLDNFQELTGRRFRMSRDQVDRLGKGSRDEAFAEFLAEHVAAAKGGQGDGTDE